MITELFGDMWNVLSGENEGNCKSYTRIVGSFPHHLI
jgi:hypothetical protein